MSGPNVPAVQRKTMAAPTDQKLPTTFSVDYRWSSIAGSGRLDRCQSSFDKRY